MVRVSTCTTVDVDCEVDVDLDDVFSESWQNVQEADETERWRLVVGPLDTSTRLLASVRDEFLDCLPPKAIEEMHRRLKAELERYAERLPSRSIITHPTHYARADA